MNYDDFPKNKYTTWYINLVETRKFQQPTKFKTESHHIFPTSIFGKNKFTVNLTHREHYIAHLLLWKIFKKGSNEQIKMFYAFKAMTQLSNSDNKRQLVICNSKIYEAFRDEWKIRNSEFKKKHWEDPEYRANQTKHNQDYWCKEENRNKQSKKRKEYFSDEDNKKKHSDNMKVICNTPEWKEQRSKKQKELSSNSEYAKKRIDAMSTKESREKAKTTRRKTINKMTKEEKQRTFGRAHSKQQIDSHSQSIKGRKKVVNFTTRDVRVVKGEELIELTDKGYLIWNDLTKEQRVTFN